MTSSATVHCFQAAVVEAASSGGVKKTVESAERSVPTIVEAVTRIGRGHAVALPTLRTTEMRLLQSF
jgi:hypothetical protein